MPNPASCRYARTHEWAWSSGDDGLVWVGLSDHAQKEIGDVVFVDMPKIGSKVSAGQAVGVVESVKAAFDIYAPVAGEVAAVNVEIAKDPALPNRSPYDEGWLFKIKPSDPSQMNRLLDHGAYEAFLKTDAAAHAGH